MILIFESHPVQYRVPFYRRVAELLGPHHLKVIYGDDFSLKPYQDQEFAQKIDWRADLSSGYAFEVLHTLRCRSLHHFRDLSGRGVKAVFDRHDVSAILLTSLRFEFDWAAWWEARRRQIPILLRTETQDAAFARSLLKKPLRSMIYRLAYRGVDRVLPIGRLNAQHYKRHGCKVRPENFVRYSVPNPLEDVEPGDKQARREAWRKRYGIPQSMWLVGFSGKLIDKKDPKLVLDALKLAREVGDGRELGAVFVGTGPLLDVLVRRAADASLPVWFPGFLGQSEIWDAYLAMDCLMLPSRQMGETWGLVVNEALHAGCAVIVSDAVGCTAEFGDWERVRVIPVGDGSAAAEGIRALEGRPRQWDWCRAEMEAYTQETGARRMAGIFKDYLP